MNIGRAFSTFSMSILTNEFGLALASTINWQENQGEKREGSVKRWGGGSNGSRFVTCSDAVANDTIQCRNNRPPDVHRHPFAGFELPDKRALARGHKDVVEDIGILAARSHFDLGPHADPFAPPDQAAKEKFGVPAKFHGQPSGKLPGVWVF